MLVDERLRTEEFAWLERPEGLAVALDARVAAQHDIEGGAVRALANDLLARTVGPALPGLGEASPNAAVESRQERDRRKLLLELHRRDPPCAIRDDSACDGPS